MIVCHCNTIAHEAFERAVLGSIDVLREKSTLKQAVGYIWQTAVKANRDQANPFSCFTACFGDVAELIQKQGLFVDEKLPDVECSDAPCAVLQQYGLSLAQICK